jgi:putative toxin-antitoxin system antitoxin component (TIGR02293 family)
MRHMATALKDLVSSDPRVRRRAVEHGLPVKWLRSLLADKSITLADLSRFLAPRRTLERRLKEGQRLSTDESDRLARFFAILELCEYTFGDREEAMDWLRSPLMTFDGHAPIDLLRTSVGADEVESLLQRVRHGMLA